MGKRRRKGMKEKVARKREKKRKSEKEGSKI